MLYFFISRQIIVSGVGYNPSLTMDEFSGALCCDPLQWKHEACLDVAMNQVTHLWTNYAAINEDFVQFWPLDEYL